MKTQLELLRAFQDKAGCAHTQDKAGSAWVKLKPYLTEHQRRQLSTAWIHVTEDISCDPPRTELDHECETIRKEWKRLAEL